MTIAELNLIHIFDPTRYNKHGERGARADRASVHLAQQGAPTSICSLAHVYRTVSEHQYRVWYETDMPADCLACQKALEVLARHGLGELNMVQLEEANAFINKLRANGS